MDHKAVLIYCFVETAYTGKTEAAFPFLDVVLHFPAPAIELDHLVRGYFHCSDNERIQVDHLTIGLFDLKDHPAGMDPGAGLV